LLLIVTIPVDQGLFTLDIITIFSGDEEGRDANTRSDTVNTDILRTLGDVVD
jgi:hypothetical protein